MITNSFKYRDLDITHISKPNLKNSYISINNKAEVILKTPKVSKRFIFELLDEKEAWIRKKLSQQIQNPPIKVNLEDEVLLFGELRSIDTYEATELRIKLENIRISSTTNILKCYNSFYKNYSVKYITPRVEYYSKIMDLKYKEIKFRKMKGRWGSCSSKKVLTFSWFAAVKTGLQVFC